MIGALWNSYWLVPLYAVLLTATVRLGRWLSRKEEQALAAPRQFRVGPFERSVGAIMAFLLGFCFAISGGNFRETQATLQHEADTIAEADRWSHLLAEADRRWLQDNLRAYVDLLIRGDVHSTSGPESEIAAQKIRSEQAILWEGLAARRSGATERAAYDGCLRAVNQFIQAYELRYSFNRRRLPDVMVLFILGSTLLVGFLVGYTSESQGRQFAVMACLFVLFITATIYLIWEVDRPREGFITTNRQNLIDLAGRLRESSP
jgi:hypothetical protein